MNTDEIKNRLNYVVNDFKLQHLLDKNIFKIDCFEKIYVYDDLTQSEIASIKDLAKYLQLPVVMVHVGRKKVK